MIIIGVDPGIAKPGIAVFNNGIITTESVKTSPKDIRGKRIHQIISRLLEYLPADLLVIEGYATNYKNSNRVHNTLMLAEVVGAVKYFCHETDTKIIEVDPATLKKFATGYGRAEKADMLTMARLESGLKIKTHDEADAYFLMKFGIEEMGDNE